MIERLSSFIVHVVPKNIHGKSRHGNEIPWEQSNLSFKNRLKKQNKNKNKTHTHTQTPPHTDFVEKLLWGIDFTE